jgi:MFS family permease
MGYISYGVILTLIPDWGEHLGVRNKGTFFIVFTLASLLVRFAAGRLSDKRGRVFVLRIALLLIIGSVFILGRATSVTALMTGAFFYGIATGLFSPASAAWTSDLSDPEHRGRAMATMYIALEAGIGIGALVAGWLFNDHVHRVPVILYGTAALTVPGLVYLLRPQHNTLPKRGPAPAPHER